MTADLCPDCGINCANDLSGPCSEHNDFLAEWAQTFGFLAPVIVWASRRMG